METFVTAFINMPKDLKENMTVVKSIGWYRTNWDFFSII